MIACAIATSGCFPLSYFQILTFFPHSSEFEVYVEQLAQHHAVTPAEDRELKKQRRLIKNRESAQLSRV